MQPVSDTATTAFRPITTAIATLPPPQPHHRHHTTTTTTTNQVTHRDMVVAVCIILAHRELKDRIEREQMEREASARTAAERSANAMVGWVGL